LVGTFSVLWTIKLDVQYSQNPMCTMLAYKKRRVFTHVALHQGPPQ
jgi:hypothetical protein